MCICMSGITLGRVATIMALHLRAGVRYPIPLIIFILIFFLMKFTIQM